MKDKKSNANSLWLKILSIQEITAIVPLAILVIVASILNSKFLKLENIITLTSQTIGSWGLLALGQAFTIIVGELDLSVGAMMAFTSIAFSYALLNGWPLWLAILIAFAIPIACELVNSVMILKFEVPAFVATLGMQYICKGFAKVVNYGASVTMFSANDTSKALCKALFYKPLGISYSFWSFFFLAVIGYIILKKTIFGRQLFSVGDNKVVAKTAGIDVTKTKLICFIINGFLVGITAILWSGITGGAAVTHGVGWEFISIAACALGGVSLIGGRGSMLGVVLGVITMGVIYNVITLLGINVNYQNIFVGLFLAFAVIFDVIRREKLFGKNI